MSLSFSERDSESAAALPAAPTLFDIFNKFNELTILKRVVSIRVFTVDRRTIHFRSAVTFPKKFHVIGREQISDALTTVILKLMRTRISAACFNVVPDFDNLGINIRKFRMASPGLSYRRVIGIAGSMSRIVCRTITIPARSLSFAIWGTAKLYQFRFFRRTLLPEIPVVPFLQIMFSAKITAMRLALATINYTQSKIFSLHRTYPNAETFLNSLLFTLLDNPPRFSKHVRAPFIRHCVAALNTAVFLPLGFRLVFALTPATFAGFQFSNEHARFLSVT